jgi:hypothetical protein
LSEGNKNAERRQKAFVVVARREMRPVDKVFENELVDKVCGILLAMLPESSVMTARHGQDGI